MMNPASSPILTPPPPASPRINGAGVFGVRPGHPVLHTLAASGARPMRFSASGLPRGLTLDGAHGRITGVLEEEGSHPVKLRAENAFGSVERVLRIEVGESIALTPPMGWNSWYVCSEAVSAESIRQAAEAMAASGLANHGWTYVNIDDCWQGTRGGRHRALQGNERFPDMPALCRAVHDLGLKIGIYSTPWAGTYAGFLGGSSDQALGDGMEHALPPAERLQPHQLYGRFPGTLDRGLNRVGMHWFCDADARQWAEWGFDYVKYDWKPIDPPTAARIARGLRASGRDLVLSLSNAAELDAAPGLAACSQLWRTTGDIEDQWPLIARGFEQDAWAPFAGPGHWNDPDMLQLGNLGVPNSFVRETRPTRLTSDEQYSHMSLWCLLAAPLLLSCDLTKMDAFTKGLLTNDEVLAVNQDALGVQATTRWRKDGFRALAKPLEDGSTAVGFFNLGDETATLEVRWEELGIAGAGRVRDLWRQQDRPLNPRGCRTELASHGVSLLQVWPAGSPERA